MSGFALSPSAISDMEEIWGYVAADNPDAADALEADIFAGCQLLAEQPEMGLKRPQWTKRPLRFWVVRKNYLLVYHPQSDPLQIVRILHAARDVPSLL